jgi:amino acid adenylation domain-containing protein
MAAGWAGLAAETLECGVDVIERRADLESFVSLGGTSLRAAELAALAERRLGVTIDLAGLLGATPLAEVFDRAVPCRPVPVTAVLSGGLRPILPEQRAMLLFEQASKGSAGHLLFTAESAIRLDPAALARTIAVLTARHESLRTMFVRTDDGYHRLVLPDWSPRIVTQRLSPPLGLDPVAMVHNQFAAASTKLLAPLRRPPVVFAHTQVDKGPDLVSVLIHHTLIDGWGIGLLWREFAYWYSRPAETVAPGASPELILARSTVRSDSGAPAALAARRAASLDGVGHVTLPSDLPEPRALDVAGNRLVFGLSDDARRAVDELASACGITRTAVLLAAWSLIVGRRVGVREYLVGVAVAGRAAADVRDVIGLCSGLASVHCRLDDAAPTRDYLRATAARLCDAVAAMDTPFEGILSAAAAAERRASAPTAKVTFAAHDDLIPATVTSENLHLVIHEGHCGGSMFNATLFVQRWGNQSRLALEYQTASLGPGEAADLVDAVPATLVDLARNLDAPLSSVRGMSSRQAQLLVGWGRGPATDAEAGVWQLFEAQAAATPDALAVRGADAPDGLSYAELAAAAAAQSTGLAEAGVRAGDHVAIAVPRSVAEIVAVLATLRIGAAYVAVDADAPDGWLREILHQTAPAAILAPSGEATRLAALAPPRSMPVPLDQPTGAADAARHPVEPAPANPGRVAYVAFTSGSTGRPKGVRVPHRAVVRLVRGVDYVRTGPAEGFLRLAPLAFDASTLEIFAPLTTGGSIEVYPRQQPSIAALADFIAEQGITVVWLTAGMFRLLVNYRPQAFRSVRQVLTGGDVVPPAQVRQLLRRYPRLRITNGYGPTENTTFTSVYQVTALSDVEDPLPIGAPVPGTTALVLDDEGRLVPPGGVGELYAGGSGLALGYLDAPADTAATFGPCPASGGERLYRTGDLVRWNGWGQLCFLGRRDNQVKIRGFRVELDAVLRRLLDHPNVTDAVVTSTGVDAGRRILAGVVVNPATPSGPDELAAWTAAALPRYAVPTLWAIVTELPVTANGKVDVQALKEIALDRADGPAAAVPPPTAPSLATGVPPRGSPPPAAGRHAPVAI